MSVRIESATLISTTTGQYTKQVFRGLVAGSIISTVIGAVIWVLAALIPHSLNSPATPLLTFCRWLYESSIGTGIRESLWVFPIIEGTHLMGIALSVGALCWFDLRLLGLALRDTPVSQVWKQVMPLSLGGFVLMFVTGLLLFWAEAITAYNSVHFWIKIALLLMAGVNALVFEFITHPGIAAWDKDPEPPARARMAGLLSLIFWTGIVITGRTMAYTF